MGLCSRVHRDGNRRDVAGSGSVGGSVRRTPCSRQIFENKPVTMRAPPLIHEQGVLRTRPFFRTFPGTCRPWRGLHVPGYTAQCPSDISPYATPPKPSFNTIIFNALQAIYNSHIAIPNHSIQPPCPPIRQCNRRLRESMHATSHLCGLHRCNRSGKGLVPVCSF